MAVYQAAGLFTCTISHQNRGTFEILCEDLETMPVSGFMNLAFCLQARRTGSRYVVCHGPVTQQQFLQSPGIEARLEMLKQQASDAQAQSLREGVQKLLDPGTSKEDGMGQSYKAWAMTMSCNDVPVGLHHAEDSSSCQDGGFETVAFSAEQIRISRFPKK